MNSIIEVLTELNNPFFKEKYQDPRLLKDYPLTIMEDLVDHTLNRMAMEYGGFGLFWNEEDAKEVFAGWVQGLRLVTAKQLFNTLYQVLSGMVSKPPRSVGEFKQVMYNGFHHQLAPSVEETQERIHFNQPLLPGDSPENARSRADQARKEAISLIGGMLPNSRPKKG